MTSEEQGIAVRGESEDTPGAVQSTVSPEDVMIEGAATGYEMSLHDALLEAALDAEGMGAQSLQGEGDVVHNVFLPNRFNERNYWFVSGKRGKPPTRKLQHRLEGGIVTLVQLHGLDITCGWKPI